VTTARIRQKNQSPRFDQLMTENLSEKFSQIRPVSSRQTLTVFSSLSSVRRRPLDALRQEQLSLCDITDFSMP